MTAHVLGILGGSGLYTIDPSGDVEEIEINTPFGLPSSAIARLRLGETTLLFLPRHGPGHSIPPESINFRANICALKKLGATHLMSIGAVGSLREEIAPGDFVIVDQFIDLTRKRASTFFDSGIVAHVTFSDPVCEALAEALSGAAERSGCRVHRGGTYVCIEGPQFSTRAESLLYRSWGASVIGMTAMPEAKLAREAELPYSLLALVTDYDCWHQSVQSVSVSEVMAVLGRNVGAARRVVRELASSLPDPRQSAAATALASALITRPECMPAEAVERLAWLIGRYTSPKEQVP